MAKEPITADQKHRFLVWFWSIFGAGIVLCAFLFFLISKGWIGYMPAIDELENPNTPKVILSQTGEAICFSRSVIPYLRGVEKSQWAAAHTYYKHIGIYAYRTDILAQITKMTQTPIEKAESLEQLRWLENGLHIHVAITHSDNHSIDTPEDLEKVKILFT